MFVPSACSQKPPDERICLATTQRAPPVPRKRSLTTVAKIRPARGRTPGQVSRLAWILGAGLVLRLVFIASTGFHNDVSAFESWTLTLRDNPPWAFYAKAGFADYPPGYFVVLWVLAKIYALIPGLGGEAANNYLLLLAYPFATRDAAVRARRLAGTACGVAASFVLAAAVGLVFHPSADLAGWMFARYAFGSNVYPYTSVNAFNLYAVRLPFWQPDAATLALFGVPVGSYALWGIGLVLAATALIVGRYLQRRDDRALLEGAMLVTLAFFILATRMHERYAYGAFLFAMPLIAFGRTGWWPSIVLSVTMYLNLAYSFAYQTVMESKLAGVDAQNLWPIVSHPAALANVVLFFWLGHRYLAHDTVASTQTAPAPWDRAWSAFAAKARDWFDPAEGTARLSRAVPS